MPTKLVKVDGKTIRVPSDATPDEIDEIANPGRKAAPGTITGRVATMSASPTFPSKEWFKKQFYEGADSATNAMPAGGGIIGGTIGAGAGSVEPGGGTVLGAIGGAGIGGMAGEALRRITRGAIFPKEETADVSDVANGISREGLKQGAYEAGGQVIGRIGKAVAPKLAEAAVAPGKRALKEMPESADPIGKTILNDSKGFKPGIIAKELDSKIAVDRSAKVDALKAAKVEGVKMPLATPQDMSKLEVEKAANENTPEYLRGSRDVRDQLHYQLGENGKPTPILDPDGTPTGNFERLPDEVDPYRYDNLRQGVDRTVDSFADGTKSALDPLRKQIRGHMSRSLHDAVPATVGPDARMTNRIPARDAALNTSFNPDVTKSIYERLTRPTGALVGPLAGAGAGYERGGVPGAIAGGVTGLVLPHILANPAVMTGIARGLNSGTLNRAVRYSLPIIEGQMGRSEYKRPDDDEQ